jgi:hypothetical protein
MKTIAALVLALTSFGALSSTADAKPARAKPKAVASAAVEQSPIVLSKDIQVKGEFGADYTLGLRRGTEVVVGESDKAPARSVTESAVGKVVRERSEELEYCWLRVPAAKRTASSAVLKLMIEASGAVAGAELEGEVPAGVSKCITAAAAKWTFPAEDEGCEIEHGLSFNAKTDTMH